MRHNCLYGRQSNPKETDIKLYKVGFCKPLSILRVGFFKGYPKTVGFLWWIFYGGVFYDPYLFLII